MEMSRYKSALELDFSIPKNILYNIKEMPELSNEELEKLDKVRPSKLSEASNISGLSAHGLIYLHKYITSKKKLEKF